MSASIVRQPFTLESVHLQTHRLGLPHPLVTASGIFKQREIILLRVRIRAGTMMHEGFGEASPLSGWSAETARSIFDQATQIDCPISLPAVDDLDQHLPALAASPVLRFGIEAAILDALSRAAGRTLSQALADARGARAADSVSVQYTLGAEDAATCITMLNAARAAGYTHAKLKVGADDCDRDLVRVQKVIKSCHGLTLRLDANGAWEPDQALHVLQSLPRHRVEMIEQPVADRSLPELLERYDRRGPMIAADESCAGRERARALIRSGRLGAIVIKPSAVGGLLPAGRIFELAERRGVRVIISNLMESAVGRRAIAHLAGAWPELAGPHGLATGQWFSEDMAPHPDRIEQARLQLGSGPGIGFDPAGPIPV